MDISSVAAVIDRIEAIENQIGVRRKRGGAAGFQQMLEKEINAKTPKVKGTEENSAVVWPRETKSGRAASPSEGSAVQGTSAAPDSAYYGVIRDAAEKYGVDPKLVSAVAEVESGYNQSSVSEVGAVGVMQLMPETAESLGVNPYDANQNIDGGTRYLKKMLDTFQGDVRKAVAAYNAGPGAVKEYGGVPPYGETQRYVTAVLDLYR